MTVQLVSLCVGARDPDRLARFWSGLLGWPTAEDGHGGVALAPTDDTGFLLRFRASDEPRRSPNQMHLDLTSATPDQQQETRARALELGGGHLDIGQSPDEQHVVLADPEGNELYVVEAGNSFLADCGFVGAVSSDGTQALGCFWSRALDWPLVWDQDEETAIRSPHGGPKISWGGPPLAPTVRPGRWRLEVAPPSGTTAEDAVEGLLDLGATRTDVPVGHGAVGLLDPDGNEVTLLPRR
ncbi:VOC family protein [Auraticoccus monumenti]|uniref:Glyoxalase-like domain-containing protein n=1 Tax=Auraticoccus monumenti TaxID=675864 RepID=A0A1G7BQ76_9ACTN|nr:VOC family protein [Auraticoccus monumenti]SDE29123.1 hypothetical protein SAMN04489747_3029 [Auraticoccus monumenti]